MSLPLVQKEDDGSFWKNQAGDFLPSTAWDSSKAAVSLAADSTSIGILGDLYIQHQVENMPLQNTLSIPELNEKYNGSGISWKTPQKEAVAQMIVDAHKRRETLMNRAYGGQGSLQTGLNEVLGFGTGMGDPALMGLGGAIGLGMKAAGVFAGEGLANALLRGAVHGGAVMTPLEGLNIARERQLYQNDVSMTDSLKNIGYGMGLGAGGEGLRFAARELPGYIKTASEKWLGRGTKVEDNARMVEAAAEQMADGKRPMVDPIKEGLRRERNGILPPGNYPREDGGYWSVPPELAYEYQPVDTSKPVNKTYFMGTHTQNESLAAATASGEGRNASTDFGQGLYGSDKLAAENGHAASAIDNNPGLIHSFDTQDAKLFDVEQPLDQGSAALLAKEIEPIDKQVAKDIRSGDISLRQAYEALGPKNASAINSALSQAGYDGLHYVEGPKDATRNGVMMFPDKAENVVAREPIQSDPAHAGGLTPDEVGGAFRQYKSSQNDLFHSDLEDQIHNETSERIKQGAGNVEDQSFLDDEHGRALQLAKIAKGNGTLSKVDAALLQEILGKSNEGEGPSLNDKKKLGESLLKEMANCIVEH